MASDPTRIIHHNAHEIRVFVLAPFGSDTMFRARYEVWRSGDKNELRTSGIIAGPFSTAAEVEGAALKVARDVIDRPRPSFGG